MIGTVVLRKGKGLSAETEGETMSFRDEKMRNQIPRTGGSLTPLKLHLVHLESKELQDLEPAGA